MSTDEPYRGIFTKAYGFDEAWHESLTPYEGGAHLYCEHWSPEPAVPFDVLTQEQAQRRWTGSTNADRFDVVWLRSGVDASLGVTTIHVAPPEGRFMRVEHLAPAGSTMAVFDFGAVDERLFWESVTLYRYGDGQFHSKNEAVTTDSTMFQPDGPVKTRKSDERTGRVETEMIAGVDVAPNWSSRPAFGDWADLLRSERA